MKRVLLFSIGIIASVVLIAQSPNAFKYQAIVRNNVGEIVSNQTVGLKISIIQGSAMGSAVYTEEHSQTTNDYGLVNLEIGNGLTIDDFSAIDWSVGPYFVQIEMDATGGASYVLMGTSQLLSVPYAMYAENAGDVEAQVLSISNDTLFLNNNTFAVLPDSVSYAIIADTANYAKSFNKLSSKESEICNAENEGIMRYNQITKEVEFCNGSNWLVLSNNLTFTIPILSTTAITDVTISSANTGGEVVDNGDAEIFEKGLCWDTAVSPDISKNFTSQGIGNASFITSLSGLNSNETYYVRTYATNTVGTGYGNEINFTTLPVLSTNVGLGSSDGFSSGGNIIEGGGEIITARGIAYSTNTNPTINDSITSDGTGTGSFVSTVTGLSTPNTKYYIRAYATNAGGTNYGSQRATATMPVITTADQSSATTTSFTAGGNIAEGGGAHIYIRGIAYGTSINPTFPGPYYTSNGTGSGTFSSTASGLSSNTLYHYRAYARNDGGDFHGEDKTAITLASVTTDDATFIDYTSFSTGGNVDAGGGETITERGIVYGFSTNPTKADNYVALGSGAGSFTTTISGLQDTGYYFRAYAINAGGISYGAEKRFSYFIESNGKMQVYPINNSTSVKWHLILSSTTNATSYTDGKSNTDSIVTKFGAGSYAAYFCANLTDYGHSDWYLPARDELNAIFQNKAGIEGISSASYWSSTELTTTSAWTFHMFFGNASSSSKGSSLYLRCVRKD
jgi:hypothetical protein